ncbi:hypothetical protein [Paenibacillus cymbidii]|uniref:hypothetical protein n=1 Tax=Paenibacillus cymbidii TaxID=1639034 RepID=UPI001081D9A4|nr:hypothetical protein [Paenibacillus cymbidii]
MSEQDKVKSGYWSIATQKHLKAFTTDSSNLDEFDRLNTAGKAGRLLGVIRGNKEIDNIKKLEKMANSVNISPRELHKIVLPMLEEASESQVELIRSNTGDITGVAEYVFTNHEVLGITGQVFEISNPSTIERVTVETMDATKKIPYLQSELVQLLENQGYNENDVNLAFTLQTQFKLIQMLNKTKSHEAIISNEYVWGPNHKKIAMAISSLDFGRKQSLKEVIEIIQKAQGHPLEKLPPIDNDLLTIAKKTGMINPITILSSRGIQKDFGFSSDLISSAGYDDDILDDVKLLLASIRFGENYTLYSTIDQTEKFLSYLIRNGKIGPHPANETDYTLLEKKGIVKVTHGSRYNYYRNRTESGYFLELIRKDVAEAALNIIKSPDYRIDNERDVTDYTTVSDTGSFITAEETRIKLGESPEHLKEAEEHFNRVLRGELL